MGVIKIGINRERVVTVAYHIFWLLIRVTIRFSCVVATRDYLSQHVYYGSAYMFAVSASAKLTQFACNYMADYPIMAAPLYQL